MLTEPLSGLFPVNTSGSTGVPLQVLRNQRDQAEVSALWARLFAAYGQRTFDRQVNVGSRRGVAKRGPVAKLPIAPSGKFQTIIPLEQSAAPPNA
jgi:phenylacetate-coenzyme A ligase PaaK-like adenylate-forming protein